MIIEDIVQVTIAGQQKPISLGTDLFWRGPSEPGLTYVKLVKSRSEINRLLGQPLLSRGTDKRKLQRTSIIESLTALRNDRIDSMVADSKSKEQKIDFDIDEPQKVSRRRQASCAQEARQSAGLPEVIEIDCPAVGDVDTIKMKVRVGHRSSPLFVELTQKAIDYLTAAIKHQIDAGDIHRKAKRFATDAQDKVSTPEGFSWSYTRHRFVKKSLVYSPKSQAKKMKTS